MRKINFTNFTQLDVAKLSRGELKNVIGGNLCGDGEEWTNYGCVPLPGWGDNGEGPNSDAGNGCGVNYYMHDGSREGTTRNISKANAIMEANDWNQNHQLQSCYISNGCRAIAKWCCTSCD